MRTGPVLLGQGYWRISGSPVLTRSLSNDYWAAQGLKGFAEPHRRLRDAKRTARCGRARRVVWRRRGELGAYPITIRDRSLVTSKKPRYK